MANNIYTVEDLVNQDNIYIKKLDTKVLQDFFIQYICSNVYIFDLSNNDNIRLLFKESQFCHIIGFHYFGYEGVEGWDKLSQSPKRVADFSKYPKFKMLQYRIGNFNKLLKLLNNPDIYIYKASENKQFSYKSKYFAVYIEENRMHKLGIAVTNDGFHYPETFLIDNNEPKYNYYIKPENLLTIIKKEIIPKEKFLYCNSQQQMNTA